MIPGGGARADGADRGGRGQRPGRTPPPPRGGGPARGRRLAYPLLVGLTLIAFLPVFDADFVRIDDQSYVTANPQVLRGLSADGVLWAITSLRQASNWHPLTWVSHMVDVSLFGLRAGAHHGTNLALHALAASLLLLALERATGRLWPGFLAAALFAVHPLRVESVAWVSERKDVLAALLLALTLLAYLRYARRPGTGRYLSVVAVFSLGLMAKPTLVTLPFLLPILDWWPLGRLHRAGGAGAPASAVQPRLLMEKLPLAALSAGCAALTLIAQHQGGAIRPPEAFPFGARIGNAIVACAGYLGKTLWPQGLISFYPHLGATVGAAALAACVALLALLTALAVALRGRRPWLLAGWLWYLGALVPMLGFVQAGLQGSADRYTYLPSIGLAVAVAWEVGARQARRAGRAVAVGACAAAVLAALTLLTWRQSGHWKNTITLFSRVVAVDPRNYAAWHLLGVQHLERGETGRAVALIGRALEIRPQHQPALYDLGLALVSAGRKDEALAQFTAFLLGNPRDAEALFNRGKLLLGRGDSAGAVRDFDVALSVSPDEPQLHLWRGRALEALGRTSEARGAYERAVRVDPGLAEARVDLERLQAALRRPGSAR